MLVNFIDFSISFQYLRHPGPADIKEPRLLRPVANVTIYYELANDSYTNIDIYDLLGRSVKKISSGVQRAGSHNIIWDATDDKGHLLKSGIYFVNFKSNETRQIKKLLLLK